MREEVAKYICESIGMLIIVVVFGIGIGGIGVGRLSRPAEREESATVLPPQFLEDHCNE